MNVNTPRDKQWVALDLPKLTKMCSLFQIVIAKTCLYNFDPLKPHFYIVKLGFTGVYIIFLISAQKQIVGTR